MRIFLSLSLSSSLSRVRGWWKFICSRYDRPPILKLDTNNPCTELVREIYRGPLYLRNLHSRAGIISPLAVPPFLLPFDKGNDRYCTFYRGTRKFVTTSHAMAVSRPWWWICYVDTVFTVSFLFSLDFSREERVSFRWLKMSVKSSYVSFQQRSRYVCVIKFFLRSFGLQIFSLSALCLLC